VDGVWVPPVLLSSAYSGLFLEKYNDLGFEG